MHYILDENKNLIKVDVEKHSEWFKKNRILKYTDLCDGDIRVSSVFVGKPQIGGMFETAILYRGKNIGNDPIITRCDTYEDCIRDHENAVNNLKINPT